MTLTTDNRDMSEMERMYLAQIEVLKAEIESLKEEIVRLYENR